MVAGIIILLTVLSVVGCIKVKNPTAKLLLGEYLDDEYKEKDVELIAWKTVKGTYTDTEHVKFKTLPEVKVASCMVKGGYEQMPDVYGV